MWRFVPVVVELAKSLAAIEVPKFQAVWETNVFDIDRKS
jgi:hypothetical protein